MSLGTPLEKSALRLLVRLAESAPAPAGLPFRVDDKDAAALTGADLAHQTAGGRLEITAAGRAYLLRARAARRGARVDPFLEQHLDLARPDARGGKAVSASAIDESESPIVWLARRKGRDGRALIEPHQLQAGERLRSEFTRAQLMPRTTSNWQAPVARDRRGGDGAAGFTETMLSARQRVRDVLDAMGPEFAGLLLDVCCFLKRLEDVERERLWPPRSAKVVLQLALERLARHYGYAAEARGRPHAALRTWLAADAAFTSGDQAAGANAARASD
ncbi:MAG: DUF6456 domain-containing protein [Pseudorhodoplanes sp.]